MNGYTGFDIVMLTGGEPLLRPDLVLETVADVRKKSKAMIIVYTAMMHDVEQFRDVLREVDGITLTLHEQQDIKDFEMLCKRLTPAELAGKSMRLNIFSNVSCSAIPEYWVVKDNIEWIKECPLPDGETLERLPVGI